MFGMEMALDDGFRHWRIFEEGFAGQAGKGGKEARLNGLVQGR